MSPEELLQEVVVIARQQCSENFQFETDGETIAAELDEPVDRSDLYNVFREAKRRGLIDCHFQGGMGLPVHVRTG